ncbi:MAG: hypothetical protein AUK47_11750 [Deltaproteobacteria bacterium CG2_30_63_29]|nr:MAG: hypothetical protein AUK47_11750 [Deltaproteobacteria bacterium CG2_30_63_29]PJB43419.1 MAG: peptidase [Deltaproteobacteria bacterium CG_4_9_14_3_um_filter_63_12]
MSSPTALSKPVLVVCIGNALIADDGVGVAIFERLSALALPAHVEVKRVGVAGLALLDEMNGEDTLIVVDAVRLGAAPGTIHVLEWDELPEREGRPVSVHGIGVQQVVELGRCLYPERTPRHVVLVGVEGTCFNRLGEGLSAEVEEAVEGAKNAVLDCARRSAG